MQHTKVLCRALGGATVIDNSSRAGSAVRRGMRRGTGVLSPLSAVSAINVCEDETQCHWRVTSMQFDSGSAIPEAWGLY